MAAPAAIAAASLPVKAGTPPVKSREYFGKFDFQNDIFEPGEIIQSRGGAVLLNGKHIEQVWYADTRLGILKTYDVLRDGKPHPVRDPYREEWGGHYFTFCVCNSAVADNVCSVRPLPQDYWPIQMTATPKIRLTADVVGAVLCDGVEYLPFRIPAGADPDTTLIVPEIIDARRPRQSRLLAGSILTLNITRSDGAVNYGGVFTIRIDARPISVRPIDVTVQGHPDSWRRKLPALLTPEELPYRLHRPEDFPGREVECPIDGVISETLRGEVRIFGPAY